MNKLFTRFMAVLIACLCFGVNAQAASDVSGYPEGYSPKEGCDWSKADMNNDFSVSGYCNNTNGTYGCYTWSEEYDNAIVSSKNAISLTADKTYIIAARVNVTNSSSAININFSDINVKFNSGSNDWRFSDEISLDNDITANLAISPEWNGGSLKLYAIAILEKDKPSSGGETPGQGGGEDPTPGVTFPMTWDFTNGWPASNINNSSKSYWTVNAGQCDAIFDQYGTWASLTLTGVELVANKYYRVTVDGENVNPSNYYITADNSQYTQFNGSNIIRCQATGSYSVYFAISGGVTSAYVKTITISEIDESEVPQAPKAPADFAVAVNGKNINVTFTMPANVTTASLVLMNEYGWETLSTIDITGRTGEISETFAAGYNTYLVKATFTNEVGSVESSETVIVKAPAPVAPATGYSVVLDGSNAVITCPVPETWTALQVKRDGEWKAVAYPSDVIGGVYTFTDANVPVGTHTYTIEFTNANSDATVVSLGSVTVEKVVEVPYTWSFTQKENGIIVWPSDLEKNDKWTLPVNSFGNITPTNGAYFVTPKVNLVGGKKYTVSMTGTAILPSLSYGTDKNCDIELIDKWGEDEDKNSYEIPKTIGGGTVSITFLCEETGSYYFKFIASEVYSDASFTSFTIDNYVANPGKATNIVAEADGLNVSLSCNLPTLDIDGNDLSYTILKVDLYCNGVKVDAATKWYPAAGQSFTYNTNQPAGTYNYSLRVYRTYDEYTVTNFPAVTTEVPAKNVPYNYTFSYDAEAMTNDGITVFDGSGKNVGFNNGSFQTNSFYGIMAGNNMTGYLSMPAVNLEAGKRYYGNFNVKNEIFSVGYSRTGTPADFVEISSNSSFEFTPNESGKYIFMLFDNGNSGWSGVSSFKVEEVVNVAPQTPRAEVVTDGESISVKVTAAERDNNGFTYADDAEFTLTFNATVNEGGEESTVNETITVVPGEEHVFTLVESYNDALYYDINYNVVTSFNNQNSYDQSGTYREGFAPKFENLTVSQNENGNLDLTFTVADKSVRGADLTGYVNCNVSVTPNGYGNAYGEYGSTLTATDVVRTPQHGVEYVFTVYTGSGSNRGEATLSYTYQGNEVWGQGDNKFNVYYDGTVHTEANEIVYTEGEGYTAELITLTDGEAYTGVKEDVNAKQITFKRTFAEGHTDWQAWYAPFDVDASEFAYAAILSRHYQDDEDGEYYLEFEHVTGKLKANVPYIVKPKNSGENWYTASNAVLKATPATDGSVVSAGGEYSFTGTYMPKDIWYYESTLYALVNGEFKGVEYYSSYSYKTLKPFRAFLKAESNGPSYLRVKVDGVTDFIEGINADNAEGLYYDLQGRMVKNPTTGVYIKDGKKVYVK